MITFLRPSLATRIRACMLGQWDAGSTISARESLPSFKLPILQRTNPPYTLRHAEPEPCRANLLKNIWKRIYLINHIDYIKLNLRISNKVNKELTSYLLHLKFRKACIKSKQDKHILPQMRLIRQRLENCFPSRYEHSSPTSLFWIQCSLHFSLLVKNAPELLLHANNWLIWHFQKYFLLSRSTRFYHHQ